MLASRRHTRIGDTVDTKTPALGTQAPPLVLQTHLGTEFNLSAMGGKNVVVVFYPLAWTPV